MNAFDFTMYMLPQPKCREDLIALALEMRDELDRINRHIDGIFEDVDCLA